MRKQTLALVGLAVLVAIGSCSKGKKQEEAAPKPKLTAGAVGDMFTDFTLKNIQGREISTKKLRNGRIAVVKFGAVYCYPCNKMVPELKKLQAAYAKSGDVVVIGVEMSSDLAKVKKLAEWEKVNYEILLDTTMDAADKFRVDIIPVTVIADTKGRIAARFQGSMDFEQLKAAVEKAR